MSKTGGAAAALSVFFHKLFKGIVHKYVEIDILCFLQII
jgi:hypothetical protein